MHKVYTHPRILGKKAVGALKTVLIFTLDLRSTTRISSELATELQIEKNGP